jgi:hypothetical protein
MPTTPSDNPPPTPPTPPPIPTLDPSTIPNYFLTGFDQHWEWIGKITEETWGELAPAPSSPPPPPILSPSPTPATLTEGLPPAANPYNGPTLEDIILLNSIRDAQRANWKLPKKFREVVDETTGDIHLKTSYYSNKKIREELIPYATISGGLSCLQSFGVVAPKLKKVGGSLLTYQANKLIFPELTDIGASLQGDGRNSEMESDFQFPKLRRVGSVTLHPCDITPLRLPKLLTVSETFRSRAPEVHAPELIQIGGSLHINNAYQFHAPNLSAIRGYVGIPRVLHDGLPSLRIAGGCVEAPHLTARHFPALHNVSDGEVAIILREGKLTKEAWEKLRETQKAIKTAIKSGRNPKETLEL